MNSLSKIFVGNSEWHYNCIHNNCLTGLPGTGKKTVCYQYAEEFLKVKTGNQRIVSTWNLETPESLFRFISTITRIESIVK